MVNMSNQNLVKEINESGPAAGLALIVALATVIPLSLLIWLFGILFSSSDSHSEHWKAASPWQCIFAIMMPLFLIKWGLKRRSLSTSGACASFIVGFVMCMSNLSFFCSLLTFFVAGSKVTKFRQAQKKKVEEDFKEGGQRNWVQVICNGGLPTQLAIIYMIEVGHANIPIHFSKHTTSSWLGTAILGSLASSCGDTFASEIGSVLGWTKPRLITSFSEVPSGTNGGITLEGTVASLLGGSLVGVGYYIGILLSTSSHVLDVYPPQWHVITVGAIAGVLGSVVDSLLGALFQYSGFDKETKKIVSRPGDNVDDVSGSAFLDNHGVNLVSSLIMALLTPKIAFYVWGYAEGVSY